MTSTWKSGILITSQTSRKDAPVEFAERYFQSIKETFEWIKSQIGSPAS